MMDENIRSPVARWGGWVLTGLFVLFMLFDAGIKLIQLPIVEQTMAQLGYPPGLGFRIGMMEAIFLILYLIPRTSVLGAVLFMGVFGGAIASHVRQDAPLFSHVLFGVYLSLFMWGGLWLRDPGLRGIYPVRTGHPPLPDSPNP
jgi:DoxX-like protein